VKSKKAFIVHYIPAQWVNKPDPSGFGKCSVCFDSYDEALQKACKLQKKRLQRDY
jgi:hypothetical protein